MKHDAFATGTKAFFTPEFYSDYSLVLRVQRCSRKAIIDWDPFNGAQIPTAAYRVGTPVINGKTASVPVKLTLELLERRFPGKPVTVVTTRESSGWLISDVIDHPGGSLMHILRADMTRSWWKKLRAQPCSGG